MVEIKKFSKKTEKFKFAVVNCQSSGLPTNDESVKTTGNS